MKTPKYLLKFAALSFVLSLSTTAFAKFPDYYIGKSEQAHMTPELALKTLQEGNERFMQQTDHNHNNLALAYVTSKYGQHPLAIVLSCIDSRSRPSLVFNQPLGAIYTAGTAGNVAGPSIFASMEYAVYYTGSKLIVVMGHTQCGAIKAACGGEAKGYVSKLLKRLDPAVKEVKEHTHFKSCDTPKVIDEIAKQNVLDQIHLILNHSAIIKKLVDEKKIAIVGAMHNLRTGKVTFFDGKGTPIESVKSSEPKK